MGKYKNRTNHIAFALADVVIVLFVIAGLYLIYRNEGFSAVMRGRFSGTSRTYFMNGYSIIGIAVLVFIVKWLFKRDMMKRDK